MLRLKVLSGEDVIKILESFNFSIVSSRGSHIKLRRVMKTEKQTLTVPNHAELDRGTLKAIFNQASKYLSEQELSPHFYID